MKTQETNCPYCGGYHPVGVCTNPPVSSYCSPAQMSVVLRADEINATLIPTCVHGVAPKGWCLRCSVEFICDTSFGGG